MIRCPSHIEVWDAPLEAKSCDKSLVSFRYGMCGGKKILGFLRTCRGL